MKTILAVTVALLIPSAAFAEQTYRFDGRTLTETQARQALEKGDIPSLMANRDFLRRYDAAQGRALTDRLNARSAELEARARGLQGFERELVVAGSLLLKSARAQTWKLLSLREWLLEGSPDSLQSKLDFAAQYVSGGFGGAPIGANCAAGNYEDWQLTDDDHTYAALFPNLRIYIMEKGRYLNSGGARPELVALLNQADQALDEAFPGILQPAARPERESLPEAVCMSVSSFKRWKSKMNLESNVKECASCRNGQAGGVYVGPDGESRAFAVPKKDGRVDMDALMKELEKALAR